MAERKFDYNNVGTVYQNMRKITGDASDGESIAGILHKIDEEVHNKVDVCEEAIFGDLGKQMLLDWDNTSANFDNFVTNFSNWSTLIAQSAGNYAQFEQDIAGFKQANPLGVTSGGITDAYTNTGYYANSYSSDEIDELLSEAQFYQLTGADYIDTGMVSVLKNNDIWEGIELALDVGTIAFSGFKLFNYAKNVRTLMAGGEAAKAIRSAASGVKGLEESAKTAAKVGLFPGNLSKHATSVAKKAVTKFGTFVTNNNILKRLSGTWLGKKILTGTEKIIYGSTKAAASTSYFLKNLGPNHYGGAVSAVLDTAKVGTPLLNNMSRAAVFVNTANQAGAVYRDKIFGTEVDIGNSTYSYFGETTDGQDVYVDSSNNLVYQDSSGNMQYVTYNDSSNSVVTVDKLNDEDNNDVSINIGDTSIESVADLNIYFQEPADYDGYFDNLSDNLSDLNTEEVQQNG